MDFIRKAVCPHCDATFLKKKNTKHRCPVANEEITSEEDGLRYNHLLYAHDIIEDELLNVDQDMFADLETADAFAVLQQYGRNPGFAVGELGLIYFTRGSRQEWLLTAAVDKWIKTTGPGVPTADTDQWLYDQRSLSKHLEECIGNEDLSAGPLAVFRCGIQPYACQFVGVGHPLRSHNRTGRRRAPGFNRQHTHRLPRRLREAYGIDEEEGSRPCQLVAYVETFLQLRMAAKRFLWAQYRRNSRFMQGIDPTTWEAAPE